MRLSPLDAQPLPPAPAARATAQARFDEGEAFLAQHKWDEAHAAFRAAVEKDPEMSEAWCVIGMVEMQKNGEKPCEAAHDPLQRCVELDPKNAKAHYGLGRVLLQVRADDARAEEHYRATAQLDPKNAYVHRDLAGIFRKRCDLDGAIREMLEYVRKGDPDGDGEATLKQLRVRKKANPESQARLPLPVARAPPQRSTS